MNKRASTRTKKPRHNDKLIADFLAPARAAAKRAGYRTKRDVATFVNGWVYGVASEMVESGKKAK